MKLKTAIDLFMRDRTANGLKPLSLQRYCDLWKVWIAYADAKNLTNLEDWTFQALQDWRIGWDLKTTTKRLRIGHIKAFFNHAERAEWIERSPAKLIKPPKNDRPPTPPLTADESRRLILSARNSTPDLYALVLVMLYSGLAIRDAVELKRSALNGSLLQLRRTKSNQPVSVDLPRPVLDALGKLDWKGERFFPQTAANILNELKKWRNRLHKIAANAGIKGFHPHRLRHTFAVRLLSSGIVQMDQLSTLMGHSSVQTTEKYYAAWDPRRQNLLIRKVREANELDPMIKELERDQGIEP